VGPIDEKLLIVPGVEAVTLFAAMSVVLSEILYWKGFLPKLLRSVLESWTVRLIGSTGHSAGSPLLYSVPQNGS